MKKLLLVLAIGAIVTSCNDSANADKPATDTVVAPVIVDTAVAQPVDTSVHATDTTAKAVDTTKK